MILIFFNSFIQIKKAKEVSIELSEQCENRNIFQVSLRITL